MNISVTYKPVELQVYFWFKDGKAGGIFGYECIEHDFYDASAITDFMTFNGVDQVEEYWLECHNCDNQFNLQGELI